MSDHEKTLAAAMRIIDRNYRELDYMRRGLSDLKNKKDWKNIKEVNEFIDDLIDFGEYL